MDISKFKAGTWKKTPYYRYFLPEKINHSFTWDDETINSLLEKASIKLGELNSFSRFVPDLDMFIRMHVVKEAVTSSRIEGTQTNIEEAVIGENEVIPEKYDDWREVNNYINAMNSAIEELGSLPLSNRLLRDTHRILLESGRGSDKRPGEFREIQNRIGGATFDDATFIPPAPGELLELLGDLEQFIHNEEIKIPHLVRIAIVHYQFETIHPFLDGNGRIGRLLITLYLVSSGIMEKPLLYLSDYFEKNRALYFDNLELVRTKNDLAQWIKFFLIGVRQTAETGVATLEKILELKNSIEQDRLLNMGKRIRQGTALLQGLFSQPSVTAKDVQTITGLSSRAAYDLIQKFIDAGILKETTGFQRNQEFRFEEYLNLFR